MTEGDPTVERTAPPGPSQPGSRNRVASILDVAGLHVMGLHGVGLDVVGWAAIVIGAVGITVGAFLPWLETGAATRHSFAVVRAARRLGVIDDEVASGVLGAWYFVPLLAAIVVLLVAVRRPRAAAVLAIVLGVVVCVVAAVVLRSPAPVGIGPLVAFASGTVTVSGGAVVIVATGRALRGR